MNNTPVFFIRDPAKFPHFIHTQKRNPQTHLKDPDMFWDYMSLNEESLLQFMRLFSDLGTPQGFTHMNAWTGHTYRWVKHDGSWVYVRLYAESKQGVQNFTAAEAATIQSTDPDYATKDLFGRIENGTFPSWTLYGQILTPAEAEKFRYNVFDLTKEWPLNMVKPRELGKFELSQNPLNYFAEIEQAAFSPANTIDGWEPSNDPVLQARLFSYTDSQRHRLGPNFYQLPVNTPINPVANFQRDGYGAVTGNQGSRYAYHSSMQSINLPPPAYNDTDHTAWVGEAIRSMSTISPIDFEQPAYFWGNLSKTDQDNLISNLVGHLGKGKSVTVKERVATVWGKANASLGKRIATGLGVKYNAASRQ
jgi:catalase